MSGSNDTNDSGPEADGGGVVAKMTGEAGEEAGAGVMIVADGTTGVAVAGMEVEVALIAHAPSLPPLPSRLQGC